MFTPTNRKTIPIILAVQSYASASQHQGKVSSLLCKRHFAGGFRSVIGQGVHKAIPLRINRREQVGKLWRWRTIPRLLGRDARWFVGGRAVRLETWSGRGSLPWRNSGIIRGACNPRKRGYRGILESLANCRPPKPRSTTTSHQRRAAPHQRAEFVVAKARQ